MKIQLAISDFRYTDEISIGGYFIDFERGMLKTYTQKSVLRIDFSIFEPKILRRISKINNQLEELLIEYK